jgi:hypothetical protein
LRPPAPTRNIRGDDKAGAAGNQAADIAKVTALAQRIRAKIRADVSGNGLYLFA